MLWCMLWCMLWAGLWGMLWGRLCGMLWAVVWWACRSALLLQQGLVLLCTGGQAGEERLAGRQHCRCSLYVTLRAGIKTRLSQLCMHLGTAAQVVVLFESVVALAGGP